jgi:alpha-D-xyloside xylohydrolase
VVREYKRRGLPLAVIVSDYFHWHMMGDWALDPRDWPDPAAMMQELKAMGVELMVSIWPTVNPASNPVFKEMATSAELLAQTVARRSGDMAIVIRPRGRFAGRLLRRHQPRSAPVFWERIKKNYFDYGVRVFWLDADEPELMPMHAENIRYALGTGLEVTNIYPLLHQQGFYEGMRAAGHEEIITLSRSGWAGTQRYGAAVWSGDIRSRFEVLRAQIPAGLNIAMSGIPWWTTDIGGFMEGDIRTDYFKELIVRWFQYGVFCPLFRLHGVRLPTNGLYGAQSSGAGNEVWSFGEKAYEIIKHLLFLREKLKPYLSELNQAAHEHGAPPMRPLYFDFPAILLPPTWPTSLCSGPTCWLRRSARKAPFRAPCTCRPAQPGSRCLDTMGKNTRAGRRFMSGRSAAGAHPGLLAQRQLLRLPSQRITTPCVQYACNLGRFQLFLFLR